MTELTQEQLDDVRKEIHDGICGCSLCVRQKKLLAAYDALASKLAAAEQQLAESNAAFEGLREWQHNELPKILRKNSELVEAADANFAALIIEHRRMCKDRDYRREKGFNDGFLQQLEKEAAILEPFAKGKSGRELLAKVDGLEKQLAESDEFHNGLNDLMNGYGCSAGTEKLPWISARLKELDDAKQQLAALRGAGDVSDGELAKGGRDFAKEGYCTSWEELGEEAKAYFMRFASYVAARVRAPLAARVAEVEKERDEARRDAEAAHRRADANYGNDILGSPNYFEALDAP